MNHKRKVCVCVILALMIQLSDASSSKESSSKANGTDTKGKEISPKKGGKPDALNTRFSGSDGNNMYGRFYPNQQDQQPFQGPNSGGNYPGYQRPFEQQGPSGTGSYSQYPFQQGQGQWPNQAPYPSQNQRPYPSQWPNQGYPQTGQFQPQGQYPNQQFPNQASFPTQGQTPSQINQVPNQLTGQYPNQQTGQFPNQQTGQFPNQQTGQFPNQQSGRFPTQQMGQYPNQQIPNQQGMQFPGQMSQGQPDWQSGPNTGSYPIPVNQRPSQTQHQGFPTNQGQWPTQGSYPRQTDSVMFPENGIESNYPNQFTGNPQNGDRPNTAIIDNIQDGRSLNDPVNSNPQNGLPLGEVETSNQDPTSILGSPVIVPQTTTPAGQVVFQDGSGDNPVQRQCVQDCRSSTQYEPVCGSDNVTYFNHGRFLCARNCGIEVFVLRRGRCPT